MKLIIEGEERVDAPIGKLWEALNNPATLARCIPGCTAIREMGPDQYGIEMQLKVAAVGGSFDGNIALTDKMVPERCRITVGGSGSLGHGKGEAIFELTVEPDGATLLSYKGAGEIGGLVAGVGQRILHSVSKHLIKSFFTDLKGELESGSVQTPERS